MSSGLLRAKAVTAGRWAARLAVSAVLAATLACKPDAPGPELVPLAAADTACTSVPQDGARLRAGVARLVTIRTADASRGLAVGLDSLNRPRMFDAMKFRRDPGVLHTQMLTIGVDSEGKFSHPIRTFMTRDMKTGTGDSKTVIASTADTIRARELMAEVIRRCVR
jgi:hypothetical protein